MLDDLSKVPGNFTVDNLKSDIDNLYKAGANLAGAGTVSYTHLAITATFENRGTAISTEYSLFEDSFATDAKRNIMWNSYLKKIKFKEPLTFQEVWTYITQELKQYMEK